jgi:hypothetical protein
VDRPASVPKSPQEASESCRHVSVVTRSWLVSLISTRLACPLNSRVNFLTSVDPRFAWVARDSLDVRPTLCMVQIESGTDGASLHFNNAVLKSNGGIGLNAEAIQHAKRTWDQRERPYG